MYLKKLEISGFKSFANKTTLDFLPSGSFSSGGKSQGITSIVGPNGSGKSNVADAIRWAMGEQSMKNLRGKKSEDIIFAGSGKKAKLSSAKVTLYFDNSDKRIPLDFEEVSVTRKLFRSGESEYLINGSRVRLIDIADLLAKAGIGKESYTVINQGMSDAVLNASPLERRTILEDAAGVKQYQIKKERSLRKLKTTKDNLERVRDLVKEIEPHLKMLKRQAEKAQKGKEVAEKLRESQTKLLSYLWHTFQKERNDSFEEKEELGRRMMNIQRDVDKLNDEFAAESKKVEKTDTKEELEKEKRNNYEKLNNLERDSVVAEGRIEILKEKLETREIIESIPVDKRYLNIGLERIYGSQKKLIERLKNAEDMNEVQDIKEFAQAIGQDVHDLRRDMNAGEVKVEKKKEKTKEEIETEERIKEFEKKKEKASLEIKKIKEDIEKLEKQIQEEIEKDRKAREHFFALERELHEKQNQLGQFKDRFNDAKVRLARVEVREEDLIAQVKDELNTEVNKLKHDGELVNRVELEKKVARSKVQKEQIGGIDPIVVEEYQETSDRFNFLTQESEDLETAIDSLKDVTKEMDKKIDKVFKEAFGKINEEFSKYFRIIFGGGKAYLIKSKIKTRKPKKKKEEGIEDELEEDPSMDETGKEENEKEEIGIDISACPPGKKIANLSMLSGGERSLTSIALLFAIIAYNPPPFAVLDEVEAALDEANSRRFSKILQELSGNTQFIAISHNRETMRQASLLYGVTMGDDGVSKLLSVQLDQISQGGKIK